MCQQVVVVANPANTNALILSENAPSIPKENITALTRLDHNRVLGQVQPFLIEKGIEANRSLTNLVCPSSLGGRMHVSSASGITKKAVEGECLQQMQCIFAV